MFSSVESVSRSDSMRIPGKFYFLSVSIVGRTALLVGELSLSSSSPTSRVWPPINIRAPTITKSLKIWLALCNFCIWGCFRTVIAVQHSPVPQSRVHQLQPGNPERNLRDLLRVHHHDGDGRRVLRCRVRSVLCDLHLHLWHLRLHQHHLHQEPELPQQRYTNIHGHMLLHRQKGLRWCLSAKGRIEN